ERLVTPGRWLHQRGDQRVVRGPAGGRRADPRRGLRPRPHPGHLAGLRGTGHVALVARVGARVLPRAPVVMADEAVVGPLGRAGLVLHETGEHAVAVLGVPVVVADDGGRVGIVHEPRPEERLGAPPLAVDDV